MNNTSRNHPEEQKEADNRYRVGAVSFFNARPLIYGLDGCPRILLQPKVPAQLGPGLLQSHILVRHDAGSRTGSVAAGGE